MADVVVTAANVLPSYGDETVETGIAGASITAGQPLYKDATDSNKLKLADANASQATSQFVGIAAHAALAGQPIRYYTSGHINPGFTVTVGAVYVLSGTAGGIAPVADLVTGWYTVILGVGITSSKLRILNIQAGVAVP